MSRYFLAVLLAMFWVTAEAAAAECATEPQSGTAHWSWRMIDGKKCWYAGPAGMSKDRLHWPPTTVAQRSDPTPADVPTTGTIERGGVRGDAVQYRNDAVQNNAADDAQPQGELSFRERWPH